MAAARHLDPAMLRPRARWRGMLMAFRRAPLEPYVLTPTQFCSVTTGGQVTRHGSFSTGA